MAKTNVSQSNAKKAAFEAAYKAALYGKPLSQGAVNKVYDQELERSKAEQNSATVQTGKDTKASTNASKTKPVQMVVDDTMTTKQKYEKVQSAYDTYLDSEEYQQKLRDAMKPYLLGNGATASTTPYGAMATAEAQKKEQAQKEESKDAKKEELGALAAYYKQQMDAEESARTHEANMKEISAMSDEERAQLEQYIQSRDSRRSVFVNDITWFQDYNKEEQSKKALIEKYGEERLEKLAESYGRHIHEQEATKTVEDAQKAVNQNWMSATFHNLLGLPARALGGVEAMAGRLYEQADRTGQYPTLEEYTSGDLLSLYGNTVMSQTAENIAGDEYDESGQQTKDGGFGRELLSYGYRGGMSLLDSLARSATGGGAAGGAALAAIGSFSQAVSDASRQGATPEQAVAMGIATAGIEYLAEKITMDEIFKLAKGGNTKALRAAFRQAGIELTTEELTLVGTLAAEAAILQEKSSYRQQIGELVANGMSFEEAKKQANKAVLEEAKQTAFVSGFSGFLGGAGGAVFGNKAQNNRTQETPQQTAPAAPVVDEGQQIIEAAGEQLAQQAAATPQETATATPEQKLAEMVGAELEQNAPAPAPAKPLTENQRHLENGIAATLQAAMQGSGQISNKTAEAILNDPMLLQRVMDGSGIELGNTKAEQRKAVKDAVANMFANTETQAVADLEQNAAEKLLTEGNQLAEKEIQLEQETNAVTNPIESYPAANGEAEVKSIGAAEQNFSGKAQYQDLLYEGNVQPDRKTDVRPMEVPRMDAAGNPVSQVAANTYGSQHTTDDLASETENAISRGELSYMEITNEQAAEKATKNIERAGDWRQAYMQWHDEVRDGKTSAEMAARGAMLLNHAAEVYEQVKATGTETEAKAAKQEWLNILLDLRAMGTNTAQGLQAMRMIRELAPPDKLDFAVASVRRMVAKMNLPDDVQIDEGLLNEYRMAETDQQRDEIMGRIQQNVADQIPSTFLDKWTALRYTNMLGNLKTQVRNFAGNVGSMIAYRMKDQVAAGVEDVISLFNKNYTRQKAHVVSRKYLQFGKDDFNSFRGAVTNGGKFNERMAADGEFEQGVMDKRHVFKSNAKNEKVKKAGDFLLAPMEGYRRVTNWLMNNKYFGDEAFGRAAYARALAGFLKANGVTVEQFQQMANEKPKTAVSAQRSIIPSGTRVKAADRNNYGTIVKHNAVDDTYVVHFESADGHTANVTLSADILSPAGKKSDGLGPIPKPEQATEFVDYARAYAVKEAQEATFKDNSALASMAGKLQKAAGVVGQGVMPFTKTPANVLTRAVEFSPIGILDTAVKSAKHIAGNDGITGADVVNSLAKTLTGTGLVALGALLWDRGLLSGGPDDDDEKEQFDKMNGAQNYALQFQDRDGKMHSYTFDWLTPVVIPMFMGAELWKAISEKDGNATFADYVDLFTTIADPMIQMSMLQGLNDSLDGIKYSDNNLVQFFLNSTISYLTQGLTNTLMGQIERSTEEKRQTTFVDKDSNVPQWLQKQMGKASQKILGWDYQQTDYRNAWGETEENEGGLLYNLLSPGYLSTEESTAVSDELYRLREATGENVFPKSPEKTLEYTNKDGNKQKKNLTAEEYETMQKAEGQTAARVLNDVTSSADYAALSDAQKAKAVGLVYDYAREQGRVEAVPDYIGYSENWMQSITGNEAKTIVNKVVGAELKGAMDALSNAWSNDFDAAESVKALESAYTVYGNMSQEARKAVKDDATGRTKAYVEARSKGVSTETFVDLYRTYWELDKGKSNATAKAQQWAYTLERAQESGKINEVQKNTLKESLSFSQYIPAEATKFNELTDSGISATDAQNVTRAVNSLTPEVGRKEVSDIQKWEAIVSMTLSDMDKIKAMRGYMTDAQEEKLDAVLDMGYSPKQYTQIYRIVDGYTSGTGKKDRTIKHMQSEFNISYAAAKKLYEVFKK